MAENSGDGTQNCDSPHSVNITPRSVGPPSTDIGASAAPQSVNFTPIAVGTLVGQLSTDIGASTEDRTIAISKLIQFCGSNDGPVTDGVIIPGTRPIRIIFIGKAGAGKSSFINGIIAALSETAWSEHASTGDRGKGVPISILTQKFEKCRNGHRDKFRNVYLPTLIDVAGLLDVKDDYIVELLRLMFYGHIEKDTPVMQVYEDIKGKEIDEIRRKYSKVYPDMRVDRVVFVASAVDPLPENLMASVMEAAKPESKSDLKRTLSVFGVLTKMDKVGADDVDSFQDTKKTFMEGLGLIQPRLLTCKNYCDDLDPEGRRTEELTPALDVPYIRFMPELCKSAHDVRLEDEVLPVLEPEMTHEETPQNAENAGGQQTISWQTVITWWQSLNGLVQDTILSVGVFGVLLLLLWVLFAKSVHGDDGAWPQFWDMVARTFFALLITLAFFFIRCSRRQ